MVYSSVLGQDMESESAPIGSLISASACVNVYNSLWADGALRYSLCHQCMNVFC